MKYQLKRDSAMYRLWAALPLGQWVTAQELRRLTVMRDGTRHSALTALIARNLVQRRQSRSHLTAYDYLKLPESDAVETPDGPPASSSVGRPDRPPIEAGGNEPFAPMGGSAPTTITSPPLTRRHGTARNYMTGCRRRGRHWGCEDVQCVRATAPAPLRRVWSSSAPFRARATVAALRMRPRHESDR